MDQSLYEKLPKKPTKHLRCLLNQLPEEEMLVAQFMAAHRLDQSSRLGESIWLHGFVTHHPPS